MSNETLSHVTWYWNSLWVYSPASDKIDGLYFSTEQDIWVLFMTLLLIGFKNSA